MRSDERLVRVEDNDEFGRRYNTRAQLPPVQPKRKTTAGPRRRRNKHRSGSQSRSQFKRSFSAGPKREPVQIGVTMLYYGKGINIPFDTQVFESKDEIAVYQQHCGGENLLVYSGLIEPGSM